MTFDLSLGLRVVFSRCYRLGTYFFSKCGKKFRTEMRSVICQYEGQYPRVGPAVIREDIGNSCVRRLFGLNRFRQLIVAVYYYDDIPISASWIWVSDPVC